MSKSLVSAGFFQFCPLLGNTSGNIEILEKALDVDDLPDILVLPELANSGYHFSSASEALQFSESIEKSKFVEFLRETSRKKNVYIVSGFNENDRGHLYNTALMTGPEGIVGKYRKMHLFMNEKDYFSPGDIGFPVFKTQLGMIGILICFDYIFPEAWRVLSLHGASIICHPSNFITRYAQKVVPAQAVMNRIFIVTANRTGTERGLTFTGKSFISGPEGDILFMATDNETLLHSESLDTGLALNKMITLRNHVLNDRRPGYYRDLSD